MTKIFRILLFVLLSQLARGKYKHDDPLKLCCDVDYYFDSLTFSCLPSNETLVAVFHHPDGSLAEEGFSITNITLINSCISYRLPSSEFTLQTDGSIIIASEEESKTHTIQPSGHCLLWMKDMDDYSFSSLICFPQKKPKPANIFFNVTHGIILPIGMAISAFFLVVTFLLYCLVPELRDQLGKSFMCSIAFLALSKVLAIIIKTSSSKLPMSLCMFTGLAMHFCFLQAFFWLNVISILVFISLWLRNTKFCLDSRGGFIASCLYAFGMPTFLLLIVILHDFTTVFDNTLLPIPGFGTMGCWFSNRAAQLAYFYAPIAILLGMNIVLFCLSACKMLKLSSSTFSLHFKQYLKLFLLMGISWIFEVLSFFFGSPSVPSVSSYIWFLLDLFNALSGVFIFIFFACNKTAWCKAYAKLRRDESYGKRFETSSNANVLSKNDCVNLKVKQDEEKATQSSEP